MATRKNMNHNTEMTSGPKDVTPLVKDTFYNVVEQRTNPVTQLYIDNLCIALNIYAQDKKNIAYKITPFFKQRGISRETISRWREKFQKFNESYEYAMECIGDNREESMLLGIAKEKVGMFMQSYYDPDWDRKEKIFADRALKNAAVSNAKFDVHMDDFAKSDAVPDKE